MMATIGTVSVKVVPEIDLESVSAQAFIEAVAAAVVEKLGGQTEAEPEAVTGVTIRVACPVCGGRLEYQHEESEAWGIVPLEDQGCVEITAHDKSGVIREHMAGHQNDGTYRAAFDKRVQFQVARAEHLLGAEKW